eukprot:CAMPEP_0168409900 /NCGR_PEP_ID=MMETSP0228-20121227/27419_1 /TAXON_ID=133427 /ORGANISM="Protoceratium reticulatum, Strain CCCM 535 (=CCMP 1889)" /LENGTH=322 /DNA_ID=CAMNT_0008423621 /DNA_START=1 /DNA_END=966 /DNA_ORIENTATION=+
MMTATTAAPSEEVVLLDLLHFVLGHVVLVELSRDDALVVAEGVALVTQVEARLVGALRVPPGLADDRPEAAAVAAEAPVEEAVLLEGLVRAGRVLASGLDALLHELVRALAVLPGELRLDHGLQRRALLGGLAVERARDEPVGVLLEAAHGHAVGADDGAAGQAAGLERHLVAHRAVELLEETLVAGLLGVVGDSGQGHEKLLKHVRLVLLLAAAHGLPVLAHHEVVQGHAHAGEEADRLLGDLADGQPVRCSHEHLEEGRIAVGHAIERDHGQVERPARRGAAELLGDRLLRLLGHRPWLAPREPGQLAASALLLGGAPRA